MKFQCFNTVMRSFSEFNQSISLIAILRPESRIANDNAVEIIDKNSKRNKQCAYMYIGAGRDVWSRLGVTMLVGNGVGQRL